MTDTTVITGTHRAIRGPMITTLTANAHPDTMNMTPTRSNRCPLSQQPLLSLADERIMDVILLTVLMPHERPDGEYEPARKVLGPDVFLDCLRLAVRAVVGAYPELAKAR